MNDCDGRKSSAHARADINVPGGQYGTGALHEGFETGDGGRVRRYLMRVTGRRSHRLIGEISAAGELKKAARRRRFPMRYTDADVLLLASVDVAHQGFSRERPSALCCSAVWRCTKILLIQRMAGIPVSDSEIFGTPRGTAIGGPYTNRRQAHRRPSVNRDARTRKELRDHRGSTWCIRATTR